MTPYLEAHPPARTQYRKPRREAPSGVYVVHTAESGTASAEGVAAFISRRSTPGSYHDIADDHGAVHLVSWGAEAFGDGTGSNRHALHLSFATDAHRWPKMPAVMRDSFIENGARRAAAAAKWVQLTTGVTIPARRITRAESENRVPGFISHGERDPGRRTDPGAQFPWDQFLERFEAHTEEIDMAAKDEIITALNIRCDLLEQQIAEVKEVADWAVWQVEGRENAAAKAKRPTPTLRTIVEG